MRVSRFIQTHPHKAINPKRDNYKMHDCNMPTSGFSHPVRKLQRQYLVNASKEVVVCLSVSLRFTITI